MDRNLALYGALERYLKTNPINEETQLKMEEYLLNQEQFHREMKHRESTHITSNNTRFNTYIVELRRKIEMYLKIRITQTNTKLAHDLLLQQIITKLDTERVVDTIVCEFLKLVNERKRDRIHSSVLSTTLSIGSTLINQYLHKCYRTDHPNKELSFSVWKTQSELAR